MLAKSRQLAYLPQLLAMGTAYLIDERKGVRFADLILQFIKQAEHELGTRAHRCAYITDYNQLRLLDTLAMADLDRDIAVFQIRAYRRFRI